MQRQVGTVLVDERIKKYLVLVADASRRHPQLSLGISPRGTLAWMGASQAMAYFQGRSFVIPDDVKRVARAVLSHRLMLKPESSLAGVSPEQVVGDLLNHGNIPVFHKASGGGL
ncbi:hypothetical protein D1872_298230 [compost metagenome]